MSAHHLAVLDLGSNSFHMVVAKVENNDNILIIDKLKKHVRLAAGLDKQKNLSPKTIEKALLFLKQLHERLEDFQVGHVRIVGTDTLRKAKNGVLLLQQAQEIMGYPIEVISGIEEARLIYRAISDDKDAPAKKLVIDIGGGSTEVIVGNGSEALELSSTHMGCVSWTKKFFSASNYTHEMFTKAITAAKGQFFSIYRRIRKHEWDVVFGTSGTIRAISQYHLQQKISDGTITPKGLERLRNDLCSKQQIPGISDTRQEVIAGGLSILIALFESLRVEKLQAHPFALREGVLFEMIGRMYGNDIREQSIWALHNRFNIDVSQSNRVVEQAEIIFTQLFSQRKNSSIQKKMLIWAARVHEVGMSIAFSGYQRHSGYIIKHADLAGFTKVEQEYISFLVFHHRGKLYESTKNNHYPPLHLDDVFVLAVLRISTRLHRRRSHKPPPTLLFKRNGSIITIEHQPNFPQDRPLSYADLIYEKEQLAYWGLQIQIKEVTAQ